MRFLNKNIKIFLILIASFIISSFSINNIFLAKSPKINPFFAQNLIAKVKSFQSTTANFFAFKNIFPKNKNFSNNNSAQKSTSSQPVAFNLNNAPEEVIKALDTPLKKVSQGVYAGEKNNIQVYEVRMNEIDYLEYKFNVNGKEVKIKVPKDQQPPSQETIEAIFK